MTVTTDSAFQALWAEAKSSPDYDEGHWLTFQKALALLETELGRHQVELARYRALTRIIQDIVLAHDERVPRGIV